MDSDIEPAVGPSKAGAPGGAADVQYIRQIEWRSLKPFAFAKTSSQKGRCIYIGSAKKKMSLRPIEDLCRRGRRTLTCLDLVNHKTDHGPQPSTLNPGMFPPLTNSPEQGSPCPIKATPKPKLQQHPPKLKTQNPRQAATSPKLKALKTLDRKP